jgi:tetratricopeptide (TPR) repeat protein
VIESAQDWQKDRIRALIAQTYRLLGRAADAAPYEADIVDSEAGGLLEERMDRVAAADVEGELGLLDQLVGTGNLDAAENALAGYVRLFDRFYDDAKLRSRIEKAMRAAWTKLPTSSRTAATTGMVEAALAHDDRAVALGLVEEARRGLDAAASTLDVLVPPLVRLAELRHRAGDTEGARAELDGVHARYKSERARIVDIDRAGILRSLAETHLLLGNRAEAMELYRQAIEEGTKNPNSRPRAMDLCDTCTSMALHGLEPDAELWRRISEIVAALGEPW